MRVVTWGHVRLVSRESYTDRQTDTDRDRDRDRQDGFWTSRV